MCDGNKMSVIDSNTGKLIASPAIGDGPDAAGWDAKDQLAFASSGDGLLSVVDAKAAGYPTLEKLATVKGARTMAYDSGTDRVYIVAAEYGPKPAATAEKEQKVGEDLLRVLRAGDSAADAKGHE